LTADALAGLLLAIDLGALARNWKRLRDLSSPAECAAVVKADAYGIGIERAVPTLAAAGCRTFFVALPEEGERARAAAPDAAIYVLNGFFAEWAGHFRAFSLRPVLNSTENIETWAGLCPGTPSIIHVDTGMNRLGLSLHEAVGLSRRPDLLAAASPKMLMSHLACADEPGHPLNKTQLTLFREVRGEFPRLPASLANSAGIHLGRDFHLDLVRPGIALYGAAFAQDRAPVETVVTLKARILQIREAAAGETIGYGATRHLLEESRIAILSAGYADGYHRMSGSTDKHSGAHACLRGMRVPILGRVSMDLIAIDVTAVPGASEGDWVELFGPNMPIDEVAAAAGTVGYEFLTGLSRRAARRYIDAELA
jgi:alanine racemase